MKLRVHGSASVLCKQKQTDLVDEDLRHSLEGDGEGDDRVHRALLAANTKLLLLLLLSFRLQTEDQNTRSHTQRRRPPVTESALFLENFALGPKQLRL